MPALTTEAIIIGLFCRSDDALSNLPVDSLAHRHPSDLVTGSMQSGEDARPDD